MKIAIIPARGGSKRIKKKNIVDCFGRPMIFYALRAAEQSGLFDKIHVSTESEEVKSVVNNIGFDIDFMRPIELADDSTGLMPVLKWVLAEYKKENEFYEDVICILPTALLLEPTDLVQAFELYKKNKKKYPLHVVTQFPVPIEWAYRLDRRGFMTPVKPGAYAKRSQDIEKAYYETGPFSIFNILHIEGKDTVTDEGFISFEIPRYKAVDIDNEEDLKFAEILYLGHKTKNKINKT